MHRSEQVEVSANLLSSLLRERELGSRATLLAQKLVELFPGTAAVVYVLDPGPPIAWVVKGLAGEVRLEDPIVSAESGPLEVLARESRSLLFSGQEVIREDYAHLHARRTLVSLAYVPIVVDDSLIGALELASFEDPIRPPDMEILNELAELAGPGLTGAVLYEEERNSLLQSVARLTQLYDIEKVFSSTLEMDEIRPLIVAKVREVLDVQAVNLWFVKDQTSLLLMDRAGDDPTLDVGASQSSGEGYVAAVSDSGDPLLISDPSDERLSQRNPQNLSGGPFSVLVCPLVAHENQVGILEVINKVDKSPFDEDDLFLLSSISESAAIALNNAGLLQSERKVEVLETLVTVSHQITSTLDLDRVLQAVVNGPASVIPYERAAIALEQNGRSQLRAVSGSAEVNKEDPSISALSQVLRWAALLREPELITQHGTEITAEREETRAKFHSYFSETGMRAFHAVPLADEEGRVGVLSFESSDPDFLSVAHLEMIKVLASQATVALRNASLYKEVPFIGVLEPLMQKKQRLLALEKNRRIGLGLAVAAALLFLILFPLPLRIEGTATVAPGHAARVGAEVEGVIRQVNVREGDVVRKGTVLGALEDWDYKSALAAAQAKQQTSITLMNHALSTNDGTEAGIQRAQVDYWTAEVARAKERLDRTVLKSPIDGVVTTSHIENLVGHKLKIGETFADVVDDSQALVDLAVDQTDVGLVAAGQKSRVKLDGFPSRTFQGQVVVVSPIGRMEGDARTFYARIAVPNPDDVLRAGMQGRGKISTGWHPAGQVLFRQPFMWIWSKLWSWFGW
jgi:RND family efflux transporter MFP subunit